MSKIKMHILEALWMAAFAFWTHNCAQNECNAPAIRFSLYLMLINERVTQRETEVFATLQHWIWGKEDNKNIKADILVLN